MLPRDNLMFNMNEGYNLKPTPEPSIIEKLASLDIDIRKLRIKHTPETSSYYSQSTANSYRVEAASTKKDGKSNRGGPFDTDYISDVSKSLAESKRSIKSRKTEMSLEEKLLKGFYKVPGAN